MKTYNFLEAINSGKRFRALEMGVSWIEVINGELMQAMNSGRSYKITNLLELVNSQFILEEEKITITESEFDKAVESSNLGSKVWIEDLKERLGFTNE